VKSTQRISVSDYLSEDERKKYLQKNDLLAAYGIIKHWAIIFTAFAMAYIWTNSLTIIIALFILGGQQLACAILMHDAGHRAIFKSVKLNELFGQWLGAYPVFHNMLYYRPYHIIHHAYTGLDKDPDLQLTHGYPTSRVSLLRKFIRDLTGITGIKTFIGLQMMHLGFVEYNLGGRIVKVEPPTWSKFWQLFFDNLARPILANLLLFMLLSFVAESWLYLLWVGAYFTTYQFVLRVRSMAEHSMMGDASNPYQNTRTTYANWLEQLLFAPYHVNYHAEHHFLMTAPSYHLPQIHQLLKKRGFYDKGVLEHNYWSILKRAIQN
jgi:fatty acid desaturase